MSRNGYHAGSLAEAEGYPKPSLRRIILPIILVAGSVLCGYAALFVGVKEDLPAPPSAVRYPLSFASQNTFKTAYFPKEAADYRQTDISVYVLRDTPEQAITFWRTAFQRRNWAETEVKPAPPLGQEAAGFEMYSFRRIDSKIILAITTADKLLPIQNDFINVIKPANYKPGDTVAILIAGDLK